MEDGYKYRGRGFNQLTFKNNYKKYAELTGTDILNTPDSLNDPLIASKVALAFFTK
ncbi:MAG: glycoside hydrolase family 19 protein [bacterium]